jgi:ferredoxin
VNAIEYRVALKPVPVHASRRQFLAGGVASAGLVAAGLLVPSRETRTLLRPPGALDEESFLGRCVRCGLCADACPGPAIQMLGIASGIERYGTPFIDPLVAGCSSRCNNCGRVCPTGAIVDNRLKVKNRIIMGKARYRKGVCRPWIGDDTCLRYCELACSAAGHHAIRTGDVPTVDPDRCVGCGLCVRACIEGNREEGYRLRRPAITVDAGRRQRLMDPGVRKEPDERFNVVSPEG